MEISLDLLNHLESLLTPKRRELFRKVVEQRTRHFTVAVQDVYQLHNTSAVIRSCDVFGIQDIHVVEEVNLKKIDREIAMGAQKWVDVHRYTSTEACIEELRKQDYRIIATSPHKGTALQDFDISRKGAIFFGRETKGLSEEVLESADEFLQIPMVGFTESQYLCFCSHHPSGPYRKAAQKRYRLATLGGGEVGEKAGVGDEKSKKCG